MSPPLTRRLVEALCYGALFALSAFVTAVVIGAKIDVAAVGLAAAFGFFTGSERRR